MKRKRVLFNTDNQCHCVSRMVRLCSLCPSFADRNGELLLEVCLGHAQTCFEHKFRVNQSIFANSKLSKLETSYFNFGNHDWSIAVYPTGRTDSQLGDDLVGCEETSASSSPTSVYLNRHTGLDRTCRVSFVLVLGLASDQVESGLLEEVSNADGRSLGWRPMVKMAELVSKGVLSIQVRMMAVNTLSEVELPVQPASPIGVPLYDNDKLAWELEADVSGDSLRMRLSHQDVKNIPTNHIRCVYWSAYLMRTHPKLESALGSCLQYMERVPLDTLFHYFVQDENDVGTLIDSKIAIKEILEPQNGYLFGRNTVRVQVEWIHSCLLFQASYQHYDDVPRIQAHQMRAAIEALQHENELLHIDAANKEGNGDEDN